MERWKLLDYQFCMFQKEYTKTDKFWKIIKICQKIEEKKRNKEKKNYFLKLWFLWNKTFRKWDEDNQKKAEKSENPKKLQKNQKLQKNKFD